LYLDRLHLQNGTQEIHAEFTGGEKTIAVLPFVDMSEAGDQQYFGDGIAEELLNALVGVPGLQVAARTSSFSFHGKDVGVAEIGQTLGVRYVLEGSVRRANDQLRMKGRYMFFRATPETLADAIDMIEQAIELDPKYWSAWGDLSYAYGYMAFQSGTDPTPNMSRSAEAAYLTLAHEPANVPGLLLRALWLTLHESDHLRAAEFYAAARAAGEDSTYWAYNIAWLHLGPLNRLQEAIELLKRAELNDPLASMPKEALAMMYLGANQLTDAEASAAELLALPGVSPSSIAMAGYEF
jgi:TolB-like protein